MEGRWFVEEKIVLKINKGVAVKQPSLMFIEI